MNSLVINWPFVGLRCSRVMRLLMGTVTLGMMISSSLGQSLMSMICSLVLLLTKMFSCNLKFVGLLVDILE